jgi:hypothetical protein
MFLGNTSATTGNSFVGLEGLRIFSVIERRDDTPANRALYQVLSINRTTGQCVVAPITTVTRTDIGGSIGDKYYVSTRSYPEGYDIDLNSEAIASAIDKRFNHTQLIRTPVAVTKQTAMTSLYGPPQFDLDKKQAWLKWAREIENAIMYGDRSITANNNTTTYGLVRELLDTGDTTQNLYHTGLTIANVTTATLAEFAARSLAFGELQKPVLISPAFAQKLDLLFGFDSTSLRRIETDQYGPYGVRCTRFISSSGELDFIKAPIMKDYNMNFSGSATQVPHALAIQPDQLELLMFEGPKWVSGPNYINQKADVEAGEYRIDVGLKATLLKKHCVLTCTGT